MTSLCWFKVGDKEYVQNSELLQMLLSDLLVLDTRPSWCLVSYELKWRSTILLNSHWLISHLCFLPPPSESTQISRLDSDWSRRCWNLFLSPNRKLHIPRFERDRFTLLIHVATHSIELKRWKLKLSGLARLIKINWGKSDVKLTNLGLWMQFVKQRIDLICLSKIPL